MKFQNLKIALRLVLVAGLMAMPLNAVWFKRNATPTGAAKGEALYDACKKSMEPLLKGLNREIKRLHPVDQGSVIDSRLTEFALRSQQVASRIHAELKDDSATQIAFFQGVIKTNCQLGVQRVLARQSEQDPETAIVIVHMGKPPECEYMERKSMQETPAGFNCWVRSMHMCIPRTHEEAQRMETGRCYLKTFKRCVESEAAQRDI